jgi:hypothetical protein
MAERLLTILAALLVLAAAAFLWLEKISAAFILATLGVVAWFVAYRTRLRASMRLSDHDDDANEEE